MKSKVFNLAWSMFRQNRFLSFSYCLKTAWAIVKLQMSMRSNIVEFTFQKNDGETRRAVGTLDAARFDYSRKTSTSERELPNVIKYFDLEKNAFRSFRAERFLSVAA
jgi:WYL_2, Sm-like SH3 beta-barrel fold